MQRYPTFVGVLHYQVSLYFPANLIVMPATPLRDRVLRFTRAAVPPRALDLYASPRIEAEFAPDVRDVMGSLATANDTAGFTKQLEEVNQICMAKPCVRHFRLSEDASGWVPSNTSTN